jgi:segregation and condensation protein B
MKPATIFESVLFAAGEPVPLSELAALADCSKSEVVTALDELAASFSDRGIRLIRDARSAQMVTAPEAAPHLDRFMDAELRGSLSRGALEALAIVAYRGPVTRPQVETIRGTHSASAIRTLAIRGLITEIGRAKDPGRPIIYDVTLRFYQHLGIAGREELPAVPAALAERLPDSQTAEVV